jgi:hypothetical protein
MAITGTHMLLYTTEPQKLRAMSRGITVMLGLPGGVEVMLYQPQHPLAADI